ncbi:hypothetical protein ES332_A13G138500v1 [Gossypium tomentosum]|uniref:Hexosyltransferase n=1 Tax=Gossypium tomentosum TaxID=34277 RepID=A0A5D2MK35_GOSTO|nr:hypothetical protein ES332_A13G138500v1 [Gossypium tomentosum]
MAPNITTTKAATITAKAPKRAYVTFLAGNGDYVKGVVGLAKGLMKVNSKHPLVVALLPDVPEDHRKILVDQGCIIREIEPFVEYSKMIYLDGDIQVFDNIDHLFDMEDGYFYAVMDYFCEKTWRHTPQYKISYCQQCPDKVQWPLQFGPKPPLYFNAGMFVYEPSLSTYEDLLTTLKVTPPTPFAEQDYLNMYFRDIYRPIPPIYNLVMAMLWRHPENIELDKANVVHYCAAGSKPRRYIGKEDNMDREVIKTLVAKWWEIYDDESLDYNNVVASGQAAEANEDKQSGLQLLLAALSKAGGFVRRINAPSAA